MQYTDLARLQGSMPLHKIIECCDDYGSGVLDDAVHLNIEAANSAAVSEVHLYCRGLYTIPFSPVPDEIMYLTTELTKVHLYLRRIGEEVPESITALHKRLLEQLKGITANTFRIDSGSDPVAVDQGPRVSKTTQRFGQGFTGELLDN
jgi:hypothetical protein